MKKWNGVSQYINNKLYILEDLREFARAVADLGGDEAEFNRLRDRIEQIEKYDARGICTTGYILRAAYDGMRADGRFEERLEVTVNYESYLPEMLKKAGLKHCSLPGGYKMEGRGKQRAVLRMVTLGRLGTIDEGYALVANAHLKLAGIEHLLTLAAMFPALQYHRRIIVPGPDDLKSGQKTFCVLYGGIETVNGTFRNFCTYDHIAGYVPNANNFYFLGVESAAA